MPRRFVLRLKVRSAAKIEPLFLDEGIYAMLTNRCLAALAIIGLAGALTPAKAGIVYATGFEAPTFAAGSPLDGQGGWVADSSPSAAVITTNQPASGLQALRVDGADLVDVPDFGLFLGGYHHDLPYDAITQGTPIVTVEAAVRLDGPSTDLGGGPNDDLLSANFAVGTNDGAGHTLVLSSNGHVYAFGKGVTPYSFETEVTLGAYHILGIRYDFLGGSVGFFVDGKLIGQNSIQPTVATGIQGVFLELLALDDGSVDVPRYTGYFDDIQVSAVPEPSTLALSGIGAIILAAVYRRRFGYRVR